MKTRIEIPSEVKAHLRAIENQVAIVIPSGSKVIFRHADGTAETLTLSTDSSNGDVTGRGVGTSLITSPPPPAPVSGAASVEINPLVVAESRIAELKKQLADVQSLSEWRGKLLFKHYLKTNP